MNGKPLISAQEISDKIKQVVPLIESKIPGESIEIVSLLKGAICLTADLIRALTIPTTVDFLIASSYGQGGVTPSKLKIERIDAIDVEDKHLLIVDDIFDRGITLSEVVKALEKKGPASIHSLVLLEKKGAAQVAYRPDFVLFEIEDAFVIGYGLDYKELYRGLDGIYALEDR